MSASMQVYDTLLGAAIDQARKGLSEGGLPIGSALGTAQGEIVARGHNRRVQDGDPMAHAEISCMRDAGRLPSFKGLILASTLMPCCLCAGAAIQFGIKTVIVGESQNFAGEPELMRSRGIEVINVSNAECIEMMAQFVREHPQLWNEDIGVED